MPMPTEPRLRAQEILWLGYNTLGDLPQVGTRCLDL